MFDTLKDEPKLSREHDFYLKAYKLLASDRPAGFMGGMNRIPWSSIKSFAEHYGMNFDEAETFIDVLRAMDDTVIESAEAKTDKQNSKSASKPVKR